MKNWLTELREKFGLSQSILASYLSVSTSVIGMAELNTRELTTHAMLLLEPFLNINQSSSLNSNIKLKLKEFQIREIDIATKASTKRQTSYLIKLVTLRKKLRTIQQKELQALNSIALASRISDVSTNAHIDADKKLSFIKLLLSSAFVSLQENGSSTQSELKEQIEMYSSVIIN